MIRPDDISAEAWDKATTCVDLFRAHLVSDQRVTIAMALMDAQSAEREACALVAEKYGKDADPFSSFDAQEIAAAIRSRT